MLDVAGLSNVSENDNVTDISEWNTVIAGVQVVNIFMIVVCSYIVLGSTILGIKGKRCITNPAKSSFNSGIVFSIYIAYGYLLLMQIIFSLVQMNYSANSKNEEICLFVLEGSTVAGYIVTYLGYLFVWFQQRRIFVHPCIRDRIGICVKTVSIVFIFVQTAVAVTLFLWHFINPSGLYGHYDCYINTSGSVGFTIGTTVGAVVVQLLMLFLSLYPAFQRRVQDQDHKNKNEPQDDATDVISELRVSQPNDHTEGTQSSSQTINTSSVTANQQKNDMSSDSWIKTLYGNLKLSKNIMITPINLAIRRLALGTCLLFFSDLIIGLTLLFLPNDTPSGVRKMPHNLGDLIGLIALLIMLGYTKKVFSFFIPSWSVNIVKIRKRAAKAVSTTSSPTDMP